MEFNSIIFICLFFPITFLMNLIVRKKYRNFVLLMFSIIFLFWISFEGLITLFILTVINYIMGCLLNRVKRRKAILASGIFINIVSLCYFKYTNFLIDNINYFINDKLEQLKILVPIGISFFVFKAISYLIDVYWNKVDYEKNIIDFCLYMLFFSQVLSGPIIRYVDIKKDLKERSIILKDMNEGLIRFILGLAKKVIIANNLGVIVDTIWSLSTNELSISVAWIGSIAYTLQIYFDFSGYSDMAIGIAKVFGFNFKENFNYPYMSTSISDFWRRWHISLSSWFKDYIYIPLGGSRTGNVYFNIFVVFLITGIWHGSAWNFIIWGIWNGFFNIMEKYFASKGQVIGKGNKIKIYVSRIYTLLVVNLGWVFFRAPDLNSAIKYIYTMFGFGNANMVSYSASWFLDNFTIMLFITALIFSVPYLKNKYQKMFVNNYLRYIVEKLVLIALFIICFMTVISSSYSSFIYFQF